MIFGTFRKGRGTFMRIINFKEGSNLTIVNTYFKKFKDYEGKYKEVLSLIFKDLDTGLKYKEEIEDPEISFRVVKPEKSVPYNRLFVDIEDTYEVTANRKSIDREAAKAVGLQRWYSDCINSGDRSQARLIHSHPDLLGTDINIEDYYRFQFGLHYQNNTYDATKSYFDIEVDGIDMAGDFPEPGECPINAITIVFQEIQTVYTLLLRNSRNSQIQEFEEFIKLDRCQELKDFIRNHVNKEDPALFEKYKLNEFKFNIAFYDEDKEIDLIADLFKLINLYKPDFALAWNMSFDVPYIIARIINLGYSPEEIISHPDFEYKFAEYYIDEKNKNDFAERSDFAIISSYSVFLDQMIQYASRRKGQTRPLSFSLDFIASLVAKVHKLDYKDITTNIMELPYKNYKIFVYYNIMDTIAQYCTEFVVDDIGYVFGKALMNNTRYSKVHRQTVYLANRGRKEFYTDGLIMGNNFNKFNEKPSTKFPGAFVADPSQVSNYSRMKIYNRPVDVFNNLDDFDYCIVA